LFTVGCPLVGCSWLVVTFTFDVGWLLRWLHCPGWLHPSCTLVCLRVGLRGLVVGWLRYVCTLFTVTLLAVVAVGYVYLVVAFGYGC